MKELKRLVCSFSLVLVWFVWGGFPKEIFEADAPVNCDNQCRNRNVHYFCLAGGCINWFAPDCSYCTISDGLCVDQNDYSNLLPACLTPPLGYPKYNGWYNCESCDPQCICGSGIRYVEGVNPVLCYPSDIYIERYVCSKNK